MRADVNINPIKIVSFPGSGNSFIRYLILQATGEWASIFCVRFLQFLVHQHVTTTEFILIKFKFVKCGNCNLLINHRFLQCTKSTLDKFTILVLSIENVGVYKKSFLEKNFGYTADGCLRR